jgi:hypothetical protein
MTFAGVKFSDTAMHTAQERNAVLREILGKNDCEVTFTKIDGSVRTMPCTLREAALPPREVTESKNTRELKPETLSVFCLDKNEWRSFRVMNVIEVKPLNGK